MNIVEYAQRLGVKPMVTATKPIDIEAGKAGYDKYLADTEAAAKSIREGQDKAQKEKSLWDKISDFILQSNRMSVNMYDTPAATAINYAINAYKEAPAGNKPKDDWTDEERWAFGEKYANNISEAYAFAQEINDKHAVAKKQKQAEKLAAWTDKNFATRTLGSLASLGINATASGVGYVDALVQKAARGYVSEHEMLLPHEVANTMQGAVSEHIKGQNKALGYAYDIGMSVGQSALAGATGGSAGALVQFFGMAASNGYTDAKARGADDNQALAFGALSGLAEAIPEMISVDKFLGLASSAKVENVFKSILKQAGAEALEEGTTSVLTEVADRWVMGGKSQYALTVQELMASGMSEAEAKNKAFTQTLLGIAGDVVTGAISGTVSGSVGVGMNRFNQKYLQKEANTKVKEALTLEASNLIAEGKKYDATSKQAARLEQKMAEGKELTGYELRRFANDVSQATQNANVDAVRQAIIEKMKSEGVSEKDAKRLGEIALNKALGNEVSKIQDVMLKRNELAQKVYNQIDADNMATGESDSEWIERTPLRQLRYEADAKNGATAETQPTADMSGVERLKAKAMARKLTDSAQYKINDASLEGKFTVSEGDKIKFVKSSENSKIHTDEISSSLTKEDIAELTAIEKLANELGVEIHVYESKKNKDGSRTFTKADGTVTSDSGWYDPNDRSIHIDLRAGNNGEGTMLYTAAHELVHFMKDVSPEHFDALEKLVTAELIKGGKSIEALLQIQRNSLIANGKNQTDADFEEVAREEMVADACMKFLASKSAIAEIKALKTKNKGLWNALKKFFTSFFNKINKIYKNVDPDSSVGKYIGDMHSKAKAIRDAFMEGVAESANKVQSKAKTQDTSKNDIHSETAKQESAKKEIRSQARVTLEQDASYMDAVNRGDMETAQRMVDEAAKAAGYTDKLYHGTKQFGFTEFDPAKSDDKISIFVAGSDELAQTYSGRRGAKKISDTANVDAMQIEEVVKKLSNEVSTSYDGEELRIEYEIMRLSDVNKLIGEVNEGVERLQETVNGKIKKLANKMAEDFTDTDADAHQRLRSLKPLLDTYQYENMSTPIYMLLHYTDVFSENAAEIADLEYKIRLMNKLQRADTSNGVVVKKDLDGYGISILTFDEARTELKDRLMEGNYALYGNPRNQLVIDGRGQNWNDIRNWTSAVHFTKEGTTVERSGEYFRLFDKKTGNEIFHGRLAVNMYSESLSTDMRHIAMLDKANNNLDIRAEYMHTTRDIARFAKEQGYESVKFENIVDNGGMGKSTGAGDVYAYFEPNNLKSADPITYDDNGNVIPLSERFNEKSKDIRHKSRGSVDSYSEKEYNDYGWARANGLYDASENERLRSLFADAVSKQSNPPKTESGEYMISIGKNVENKIAYMKGEIDNPIITRVLKIDEYNETQLDKTRRNVYAAERRGIQQQSRGVFQVYTRLDFGSYADYSRNFEENERNNLQLRADRGAGSGTTYETERGIPQDLEHFKVIDKFTDVEGRSRNIRRINGKFMVEGTPLRNYMFDTVEEAIKAENKNIMSRYAKNNDKSLLWVKKQVENNPRFLYKEIRSKARAVDVNGNELSEAQQEYFKDSKVRDSKGNLMVLYHGTTADFNEFKKGDVGFHFGTKGAARGRVGYGKNATLKEVYLNIKNPIVFNEDLGSWDADFMLTRELYERGILTQSEAETVLLTDSKLYKRTTEAANKKLAEVLLAKGYDGIQYTNTHESKKDSTSYIIFDSNQAKLTTNTNPTTSKDIRHKARSTPSVAIPYTSPTANTIVTNIDSGYEYTKRDKIKTGYIAAQIAMTNAQAGIEARAKQYSVKDIESLVQAARVATNQAQEMIGGNQYRIGSDTKDYLGEGLQKIIAPVQEKGEEYERTFYDYLFHYHNADRMSLERRSIEWNEQKKEEMKNLAQRAKEIRNEEMKFTGEKTKWAYKRSEEARSERNRIDLKLKELSRELVSIGKARRKLQKEIDSFTVLKNKPVIGLNHDEVEAKKAEILARITELVAEKRKLGTKKANEEKVKEINAEIEALKKERSELTAEVTEEKSREIIAEYDKNYPEFIDTAQKLWKYSENLNLFRVDTGLIDQEQFDYLKKLYPHYVPSYRADTKTGIAAIKGKNNVAVSQSIRTATGSTKDLLNPIVIMARQTMETIRAGRINMIAKSLYDGAAAHKDTTYIKEISKKAVDKSKLVDLDPMELRPKSNQVTFFDKGERITLQVSSDIFAGFDAFTPQVDATNPIIQITHKANDIFKKLVTSWNPLFIVRNSVRDIQDAGINTKYGKTFVQNYVRAGNEIRTGGELWQLYKAMGGTNVNLFDFDEGFKGAQSKMGFEAGLMKKIANANAFVECLPRFAEFISSIEAGNTAEQAMLDAADVTTNFARTGTITKKLNSTIIPFLNPAIQGASKAIRNITSIRGVKDALTLIVKAALVGAIPFVLNNLLYDDDEDYEVLKETDKENNYLIKVGDKFFKLPRGRMASVLAGATNRTINSIEGEEKAWKGYLKNVSTQMNPVENMARTIFSPFMDVKNNVTWYVSAIEGREFENKSPSQRYDESTSSIAIAMGKILNYSPKKIHYILDQYSGVVGDFILPATTKKAEKGFVSGNFVIDPVTSNKLSDQFYDMYYDAQYAKSDNPDDKTAEYQVKHLNRIKSAISELYDKKDEIQNSNMSNKEKLAETRAIQILINEMFKTALNDYELVTNAIEATSTVDDKYRYTEVQRLVYGAETALKDYDDTVYEKSTLLTKVGISYNNFYEYYFGIKDVVSDKDKKGNTISGSKKAKVIEKINDLNLSYEKKLLLIAYSGYTIDNEKDREKLLKYINRLTLSTDKKKKFADMCGFKYKNGKIVYE